ncbi:unnamed protein product [Meganyctiphanes norvegica]|uniref:Uncharacterized protein n=1 Tax=Meganyctiphanes norvegica TaxID=48144 RepID=A0AAV2RWW2_MEGNR
MSVHWMSSSSSRSHNGGGLLPTPRAPLGVNAGNPRAHLGINTMAFPIHSVRGARGGKGGLLSTPRTTSGQLIPPLGGSLLGNAVNRHAMPHGRGGPGLLPTPGISPGLIPTPPDNENFNPLAGDPGRGMPPNYIDNGRPNLSSRGGIRHSPGLIPLPPDTENLNPMARGSGRGMPSHYMGDTPSHYMGDTPSHYMGDTPSHYMGDTRPNSASRGGRGLSIGLIPTPPDNENLNPLARGPGRGIPPHYLDSGRPSSSSGGGRGFSPGLIPTPPDNENLNPLARGPCRGMPQHFMDNSRPNSASRGGRGLLPSPPTPPEGFSFSHNESCGGLLPTPGSSLLGNENFHPAGRGSRVALLPTPGQGRGGLLPTPPGPRIVGSLEPGIGTGPPGLGRGPPGFAMGRGLPGMGIRTGLGRGITGMGRGPPGLGRGLPGMGRGPPGIGRGMPGIPGTAATGLLNLVQILNMGRGNRGSGWAGNRPSPMKIKRLSLGMQPNFDSKKSTEIERNHVKANSSSMRDQNDETFKGNRTEHQRMNESNKIETEWSSEEADNNCVRMQDSDHYTDGYTGEENVDGEGEYEGDDVDFGVVYDALNAGTEEQNTAESAECDEVSDFTPRTNRGNDNCRESEVKSEVGTRRSCAIVPAHRRY